MRSCVTALAYFVLNYYENELQVSNMWTLRCVKLEFYETVMAASLATSLARATIRVDLSVIKPQMKSPSLVYI